MRPTVDAMRHLENAVTGVAWAEGVVLRYGTFYGPGTNFSLGPEDAMVEAIRKRQIPLLGKAGGVWSFIHIEDAADATVNAIEGHGRGIYNVVDDEPAAVADWLPAAAQAVGAPAPRRVPRWLGRLFAGETATVMMTEARGASNTKAKSELAWTPRHRAGARASSRGSSTAPQASEGRSEPAPGERADARRRSTAGPPGTAGTRRTGASGSRRDLPARRPGRRSRTSRPGRGAGCPRRPRTPSTR